MSESRVLLIEDDAAIAKMYRMGLERAGWRVKIAPDGPAGLAAARELAPEVVLLDIMLPGMDGLEVLRRLRSEDATRHSAVVVLTNTAGLPRAVNEASRLGVVDWMVKSRTTPQELVARLEAFKTPS